MYSVHTLANHSHAGIEPAWKDLDQDQRVARLAHDWAVPVELVDFLVNLDRFTDAVPVLVIKWDELDKKVTALESRIAALEAKQHALASAVA